MTKQEQKAGDNSTNVQARDITVYQGLTYEDVKQVALDVFRQNFIQLSGKARETIQKRGEDITEKFLDQLQHENPAGFAKAEDPDFQHALFTVQKEYARTGDKDLGDLLVDLLIDRSKRDQRDILQIVLNESLSTAPKLTNEQLAALAIIFYFRYTQNVSIGNYTLLSAHLDRHIAPFADKIVDTESCYQHLQFTACGSISPLGGITLEKIFAHTYKGLFTSGFEKNEISSRSLTIGEDPRLFVPCLNDPAKIQVKAINKQNLDEYLERLKIPEEDRAKVVALFELSGYSEPQIRDKVISLRPYMKHVFDVWNGSRMQGFNLTSVGMAIGHANIKRVAGEFSNLSIWVK